MSALNRFFGPGLNYQPLYGVFCYKILDLRRLYKILSFFFVQILRI